MTKPTGTLSWESGGQDSGRGWGRMPTPFEIRFLGTLWDESPPGPEGRLRLHNLGRTLKSSLTRSPKLVQQRRQVRMAQEGMGGGHGLESALPQSYWRYYAWEEGGRLAASPTHIQQIGVGMSSMCPMSACTHFTRPCGGVVISRHCQPGKCQRGSDSSPLPSRTAEGLKRPTHSFVSQAFVGSSLLCWVRELLTPETLSRKVYSQKRGAKN